MATPWRYITISTPQGHPSVAVHRGALGKCNIAGVPPYNSHVPCYIFIPAPPNVFISSLFYHRGGQGHQEGSDDSRFISIHLDDSRFISIHLDSRSSILDPWSSILGSSILLSSILYPRSSILDSRFCTF